MVKKIFIGAIMLLISTNAFPQSTPQEWVKKMVEAVNDGKRWKDVESFFISEYDLRIIRDIISNDAAINKNDKESLLKEMTKESILDKCLPFMNDKISTLDRKLANLKKEYLDKEGANWQELLDEVKQKYGVNLEGKFSMKLVAIENIKDEGEFQISNGWKKINIKGIHNYTIIFEVKTFFDGVQIPEDFMEVGSGKRGIPYLLLIDGKYKLFLPVAISSPFKEEKHLDIGL